MIREPVSERFLQKLRHSGVLPACEVVLREFEIAEWFVENGGKHPNIVYRHAGIEHRFPIPSTGITKGAHANRYVAGNLRRKIRGEM